MMSSATKIKGQGVGSAYMEQVSLVREGLSDKFDIYENKNMFADITHYHTVDLDFALLKKIITKNGKSLGYVHMLPETVENSLNLPEFAKSAFFWYMIKFYNSMDYLVTVNPYFIDELVKYGIPEKKITYIPNFVSKEQFYPYEKQKKAELKEKYGINKDTFTVLSAGQLQVRKGIFDFLKIAEKMPHVEFIWAGGFSFGAITDGYKELKEVMQSPPPNVKFLGIIERKDMNEVYNLADVMFLASFEELFPMVILEAMCVNVPVLLRDLDIYNNILFDFYLKSGSTDGFIEIIEKLRTDEAFYKSGMEMSRKGNEFYSKENVLMLWDELYTNIYKSTLPQNPSNLKKSFKNTNSYKENKKYK